MLLEDKIILVVPVNHPWAKYGRAMPTDLIDQPFIRREENSGTCEVLFDSLKAHGITIDSMNTVMELGNAEAVEMAVERGIGIAFVSELVAARGLALGRVKKVDVEGLELTQQIYLCRHVSNTFTRAEAKFWEFVQEHRDQIRANLFYELADVTPA
jgi:DNA-binding transcriptional LysR family regulator